MNDDYATAKADGYTVAWREPVFRNGYYYLLLDEVSQPYFEGAEIVEEIPPQHEWHEPTMSIQIVMNYEDNLKLLADIPELAMYRKINDIHSYIENGNCYIYVNYILEEHQSIFQNYNAIINTKTE
jgi:hypothetical protein